MSESSQFDNDVKLIGERMGVVCDIFRPNYTAVDQSGGTRIGRRKLRLDTQALRYLEPAFPGVYAFEVFGDRKFVQVGDVVVPVNGGAPATIMQTGEGMKGMVGILTDRQGYIREEIGNTLYTGIRFQWVGPSFPGSGLNEEIEESFKIPKRKIAMRRREGIGFNPYLKVGMKIVETDNEKEYVWMIMDIISTTLLTIMSVRSSQ